MRGTYDNFQDMNHLDMGFIWIFIFWCGGVSVFFFCVDLNVNVYVVSCECFVCVFHVDIMFVCFEKKNQYSSNMNFKLKYIVIV